MKYSMEIPNVSKKSNYWFVRTEGGKRYNEFLNKEYIAVCYFDDSKNLKKNSRIIDKMRMLNEKDYVLIPSEPKSNKNSQRFSLGIIIGKSKTVNSMYLNYTHEIQLRVKWIKTDIDKESSNVFIQKMFYNHGTIQLINNYSSYIESVVYPVYKKGDSIIFNSRINTREDVQSKVLADYFLAPYELIDLKNTIITTKTIIQSPGIISSIFTNLDPTILISLLPSLLIIFSGKFSTASSKKRSIKAKKIKVKIKIPFLFEGEVEMDELEYTSEKYNKLESIKEELDYESGIDNLLIEETEDEKDSE